MKKPKVIITRRLQDRVEKRMKELFNVDLSSAEYPISKQELLSAVKDAEILVPTIGDKIDASILKNKWFGTLARRGFSYETAKKVFEIDNLSEAENIINRTV